VHAACIIQYSNLDIIVFASRSILVYSFFTSMPSSGSCLQVRPDLRSAAAFNELRAMPLQPSVDPFMHINKLSFFVLSESSCLGGGGLGCGSLGGGGLGCDGFGDLGGVGGGGVGGGVSGGVSGLSGGGGVGGGVGDLGGGSGGGFGGSDLGGSGFLFRWRRPRLQWSRR